MPAETIYIQVKGRMSFRDLFEVCSASFYNLGLVTQVYLPFNTFKEMPVLLWNKGTTPPSSIYMQPQLVF